MTFSSSMKLVTATISITGVACLMVAIAVSPSIFGISRSIRITSGPSSCASAHGLAPSAASPTTSMSRLQLQEAAQAAPHDLVVVDQHDADALVVVGYDQRIPGRPSC